MKLTKEDLEQSLMDLDNGKYPEERFSTRAKGYKYYCGNDHNLKRVVECAYLNNGKTIKYTDFRNSRRLRAEVANCGIEVKVYDRYQ